MKIVHVVRSLLTTGGVSIFAAEAAGEQARLGHLVSLLYTWLPRYPVCDKVDARPFKNMNEVLELPDVVHVHALWMREMVRAMFWCWRRRIPYVVSPHGGLMPRVFTKGRIKKWLVWHFMLKPLVRRAAAIHCTSSAEVEACKTLGLKGPFVVAPLGVKLPELNDNENKKNVVLFLGRISEEKGLVNLLDVWKLVRHDDWTLKIAGPNWGYRDILDAKIVNERIAGVEFVGTADDAKKDSLYREAKVFVLPSPMENFSMVVLEALAYGVPTIATKGAPWAELESERCGRWIEQGVEPLRAALAELMALSDEERVEMGARGRALAAAKYQWPAVAKKLLDCYAEVVG